MVDEIVLIILRVEKGMYGLPYTRVIVQKLLQKSLKIHDYTNHSASTA
jgi:hypothetical protein